MSSSSSTFGSGATACGGAPWVSLGAAGCWGEGKQSRLDLRRMEPGRIWSLARVQQGGWLHALPRLLAQPSPSPAAAGLVVALPAAYFASRGMINRPLGRRLSLLFLMGGMQGLVGWWMVRSGFRVSGQGPREGVCGGMPASPAWPACAAPALPAAPSFEHEVCMHRRPGWGSWLPHKPLLEWWRYCCCPVPQEPEENEVPRVSTYRMAGHLASAFAIYSTLVWTTLSVAVPLPPVVAAGPEAAHAARLLARWAHPLAAVIGITAMSGCFVVSVATARGAVQGMGVGPMLAPCLPALAASGMVPWLGRVHHVHGHPASPFFHAQAGKDAGRAYNTWPDMNGEWIPSEYWSERLPGGCAVLEWWWRRAGRVPRGACKQHLQSAHVQAADTRTHLHSLPAALRNLFENTAAVQFNHRMLAYTSLAGVVGMWRYGSQLPALPRAARLCLHALAAATAGQVRPAASCRPELFPCNVGGGAQPPPGALALLRLHLSLPLPSRPSRRWPWASPPCSPMCPCRWEPPTRAAPWCCSRSCWACSTPSSPPPRWAHSSEGRAACGPCGMATRALAGWLGSQLFVTCVAAWHAKERVADLSCSPAWLPLPAPQAADCQVRHPSHRCCSAGHRRDSGQHALSCSAGTALRIQHQALLQGVPPTIPFHATGGAALSAAAARNSCHPM